MEKAQTDGLRLFFMGPPRVPSGLHPEPEFRGAAFLPYQARSTRNAHTNGFYGQRPMSRRHWFKEF